MNVIYTVKLANGIVGTIDEVTTDGQNPLDFEIINVHLHDENGFPIEAEGKPVDILGKTGG